MQRPGLQHEQTIFPVQGPFNILGNTIMLLKFQRIGCQSVESVQE